MISFVGFKMERIQSLRKEIGILSKDIAVLLLKRREMSLQIQALKQEQCLPSHDEEREKELIALVTDGLQNPEKDYICEIFKEIFYRSREGR